MSDRLKRAFEEGRKAGRPLFIPYVTGGYPTPVDTVPILLAMEAGGADIIEIGVPFTDPLADGATIQHANQVAIEHGVTLAQCFEFVREARAQGLEAPVLFMGYFNPILSLGEERAAKLAHDAGSDGFIVVDLPPEEAGVFVAACRAHDMSFVPLVAPTTAEERIAKLDAVADAFIYCVSMTGTTGGSAVSPEALPEFLARVRRHTKLPLVVGFGISTRAHVEAIGKVADAAAVGSAIIACIDAAAGRLSKPGSLDRGPGIAQSVREFVENVSGH
ncbi:MAG: tryptophan synthase subunit alpha [Tepidiformaceae bacterium]